MGQKTNPVGFRLGITRTWDSLWFAKRGYADLLKEDLLLRKYLKNRLAREGVPRITIQRTANKVIVTIRTARPGMVIGRKGEQVEKLSAELRLLTNKDIDIKIEEVKRPEIDAQLVAENIARQLEQRVSFRRAMKRAMDSAMTRGAKGIRVKCSGRLGGAEIARQESYRRGRVPLHTLRADIDYAHATAFTTFGTCGVKVWVFNGEILDRPTAETITSPSVQA